MPLPFKLPAPVRPLYVWGGYIGFAIVLAIVTKQAQWASSVMGVYLLWAIFETVRYVRMRRRQRVDQPQGQGVTFSSEVRSADSQEDVEAELEKSRKWTEDDDVRESQRDFDVLWTGQKMISFVYRNKGYGSPLEVTATVTKVISPEFGEDANTYFQGVPTGGVQRYFCLGYVKGRKVTDTSTGEVGTLRQILGVKRRVSR